MGRRPLETRGFPSEVVMVGSVVQDRQFEASSNMELEPKDRAGGGEVATVEVLGVTAKCYFSQLHDVIQRLDERKKELVMQTGFYGLLYFPPIRQMDRRFVVWLMCRVDALAQTLVISEEVQIPFCKEDVGRIFGIPCGGKPVAENGRPKKNAISKVMIDQLGMDSFRNHSIKGLQDIILREYGRDMTDKECTAFKVAFVAYVMSTLLCPGSRFDHASTDYWGAFIGPDEIASYDWCGYVIERLMEAVVKIKMDLNAKRKLPIISGCNLFLQVLYLDSIDLGVWSMEHNCFPRIRSFGPEKLRAMIRADTVRYTVDMKARVFGKSKLRCRSRVCYSWAGCDDVVPVQVINDSRDVCGQGSNKFWEASLSLARELDAPDEVAARLYNALTGIDTQNCMRVKSAICSVAELVVRGVKGKVGGIVSADQRVLGDDYGLAECYNSGDCKYNGNYVTDGVKVQLPCGSKRKRSELVDVRCIPQDGRFIGPAALDSSSNSSGEGMESHLFEVGGGACSVDLKDPWTLGFKFKVAPEEACRLLGEVLGTSAGGFCNLAECDGNGVKLSSFGYGLIGKQLSGESELECRLFTRVLSAFKERDDALYSEYGACRWRRFVPPEFMEALLAGRFGKKCPASWVDAEIENADCDPSGMIFFPAFVSGRWVCYVWVLQHNMFYIFDPSLGDGCGSEDRTCHENVCNLLCDAFCHTLSKTCGWSDSRLYGACMRVLDVDHRFLRSNRSGVACLYFCAMFDGVVIRGLDSLEIDNATPVILSEALDCIF